MFGGQFAAVLPVQIGNPTDFARRHRNTLLFVLTFQFAVLVLRVGFVRSSIIPVIIACAMQAVGWHAWRLDMHITWTVLWTLLCVTVGIYDIFACLLPILTSITALSVFEFSLRVAVPASEFAGAILGWLLWMDWRGSEVPNMQKGTPWQDFSHAEEKRSLLSSPMWTGASGNIGSAAPVNVQENPFMTRV